MSSFEDMSGQPTPQNVSSATWLSAAAGIDWNARLAGIALSATG